MASSSARPRRDARLVVLFALLYAALAMAELRAIGRAHPIVPLEDRGLLEAVLAITGYEALLLLPLAAGALVLRRLRVPVAAVALLGALLLGAGYLGAARAPASVTARPRPAAPPGAPPGILLVTIDTLRRDHVGAYGGGAVRTPNLDAVASRGATFLSAWSQAPLTAPSHASLLSGLIPPRHGSRYNGVPARMPEASLAPLMKQAGYETAAVVSASVLEAGMSGLAGGFDLYDDRLLPDVASQQLFLTLPGRLAARLLRIRFAERRARAAVERARGILDASPGALFLWLHLYDPHIPYDPPAGFAREADPGYEGSFRVDRDSVVGIREGSAPASERDLEHGRRLYAAEVAYVDEALGPLLADAQRRGMLVVVASDHGESLGEHGYTFFHGENLLAPSMAVPLLVAGPGVPAGVRVPGLARLVDVLPTLLELAGLRPLPGLDGRSLVPQMGGASPAEAAAYAEDGDRLYLAPAQGTIRLSEKDVALRTSRYNYVVRPATGAEQLYDLAADPGESRDVAAAPELAAVKAELRRALEGMTDFSRYGDSVPIDPEAEDKLRGLGYVASR